jgi:hypothetical protein
MMVIVSPSTVNLAYHYSWFRGNSLASSIPSSSGRTSLRSLVNDLAFASQHLQDVEGVASGNNLGEPKIVLLSFSATGKAHGWEWSQVNMITFEDS